jgi:hypothetical protein
LALVCQVCRTFIHSHLRIPLLPSIFSCKPGHSSVPITIHLSYHIRLNQSQPPINQFDFMFRWLINCEQLSAVIVVYYTQTGKYGFWFDVVLKQESAFMHEVTSPCRCYLCIWKLCLLHRMKLEKFLFFWYFTLITCVMTCIFRFGQKTVKHIEMI